VGDFRKLLAWQEAKRFSLLSHKAIALLPAHERYALGAQWRRAAYSVALNIAEGAGQPGRHQFKRYLTIAMGSLDELQAVLELAEGLGYLERQMVTELQLSRAHCARLVIGLRNSL